MMGHYEFLDLYPKPGDRGVVNAVIETPKGSQGKYDLDPRTGILFLDRAIHSALSFPFNYGYLPGTLSGDGDPLDAVILSELLLVPGCVAVCQIVGAMMMRDEGGVDTKVLGVVMTDPRMKHIRSLRDIPPALVQEIEHFFVHIKDLEDGKWAEVSGFVDVDVATDVVEQHCLASSKEK